MNIKLKQELILAQQNHELVAIYNFENDETFSVGYIVSMDNRFVLILGLDMESKINGLNAIRLTSIHDVIRNSDYLLNVEIRRQNAIKYGYYDIWQLEDYLKTAEFGRQSILVQLLTEAYQNEEPVVIGTKKYKGRDDFEGLIHDLDSIKITLHYINFEDFSNLWEIDIMLSDIDYLRVKGMQSHNSKAILCDIFDEPKK